MLAAMEKWAEGHPKTHEDQTRESARFLEELGPLKSAEELYQQTSAAKGPEHPDTLVARFDFAIRLRQFRVEEVRFAGRAGTAAHHLRAILDARRRRLGVDHKDTLACQIALCDTYMRHGLSSRDAEAEPVLRECLAILKRKQPDDWKTFDTECLLGIALTGLKKYSEAEPLLVAGYEGMKQREKTMPPQQRDRLAEAADRLVRLYDAMDKKDEAAKWRKIREQSKTAEKTPATP